MQALKEGDLVRLVRPMWWAPAVPVGCLGVVLGPSNETMVSRGRPYRVEFDVAEYRLSLREEQYEALAEVLGHDAHRMLMGVVRTDVGPGEIEFVEPAETLPPLPNGSETD